MTSQFTLWLYPILVLSTVSLFVRIRLPWQWSWGFIVQSIPLIACGALGLTVGPDWLFAVVGWALVFLFYLPPRLFYSGLQRHLTALDADKLRRSGQRIALLFWGVSGEFWKDMSEALALFIERKPEEAERLLTKWQSRSGLPKSVAQIPDSYRLIGNGVMWRWQEIIDVYEAHRKENHISSGLLLSAARAFAETGQFKEASTCIKEARVPESNLPLPSLALTLLPFFALIGAKPQTDSLLAVLSEQKKEFPIFSKLYWEGRCLWSTGDFSGAQKCLQEARAKSTSELFRYRIDTQLEKIGRCEPSPAASLSPEDKTKFVDDIFGIFSKSAFVQEIISPRRKSLPVILFIIVILIVYVLTDFYQLTTYFGGPISTTAVALHNTIFNNFALYPVAAVGGQYWRFFSYLFLHAHFTHAALNIVGLYWFGRVAENIFGTSRFIAIYIVGGLLSGVAHALLCPDQPAVGASGAVMAMFGAVAAGIYRLKDKIPRSIWRMELSWLVGLALAQLVLDHIIPHVASFAHLGGLLAGVAIGMILSIRTPSLSEVDGTQKFIGG